MVTKYDKIRVLMITDAQKTYLIDRYKPENVLKEYKNALVSRVGEV